MESALAILPPSSAICASSPVCAPCSAAMMARLRSALVVEMCGVFRSACARRRVSHDSVGPDADRFRALHARDAGGPFRRPEPVVRWRDRQPADGESVTTPTGAASSCAVQRPSPPRESARTAPIGGRRHLGPA